MRRCQTGLKNQLTDQPTGATGASENASPTRPAMPDDAATNAAARAAMAKAPSRGFTNEIDFWRGFALISIFINHIPGNFFEKFTHRAIGLSDSAELFVFLAGVSVRFLADSRSERLTIRRLFMRMEARAFTIYCAQLVIISLGIAMLATAAIVIDQPLILNWHNASVVFADPVTAHIGIVLLSHQLGYFDILPLYVVLIALSPFFITLHRFVPWALLPVSLTIWGIALVFGINLPSWPNEGVWFFNPLSWQLIFVLGYVLAKPTDLGAFVQRHRLAFRIAGLLFVVAAFTIVMLKFNPNPLQVPWPHRLFTFNKMYLSPGRFLHLLALVALIGGSFPWIVRWSGPLAPFLSLLGRHSLEVFCAGSLLSLAGQLLRTVTPISIVIDAIVIITGIAIMALVAWLQEWRTRL